MRPGEIGNRSEVPGRERRAVPATAPEKSESEHERAQTIDGGAEMGRAETGGKVSIDARGDPSAVGGARRKREKELHRPGADPHEGGCRNGKRRAHKEVNQIRK